MHGQRNTAAVRPPITLAKMATENSSRSTLAVLLQFKVAHGMLRSDLTQRLRSHLTQHAGMGSEAKVIELAGGKSGHLKPYQRCMWLARYRGQIL